MNKRQKWLKVHKLKEKGLGRNEISKRLNLPRTTVSRILNDNEESSTIKCRECGKEFIPNKFHPGQDFCCTKCRKKYNNRRSLRLGMDKRFVLKCSHCGALFKADRKTRKYCCRECYLKDVSGEVILD